MTVQRGKRKYYPALNIPFRYNAEERKTTKDQKKESIW